MRNALALTLLLAVAAIVAAPAFAGINHGAKAAATQRYKLSSTMTAKQVTSPRPTGGVSDAQGKLSGQVTVGKSSTATWALRYSGLTGQVRVAQISYRAGGQTQVIRLCAPCKKGSSFVSQFPSRTVAQAFVQRALVGKAYVLLKTKKNPRGEVRGVVKAKRS